MMREVSREFQKINADALRKDFQQIVAESPSEEAEPRRPPAPEAGGAPRPGGGKTPNLDQYTVNLPGMPAQGKIDPVLARDFEIRQVVDILDPPPPEQSRSWSAKPASARPPWWKASRCASCRATCRRC